MSQPVSLSNIPTEIHHEIFTYLDYVRDICCDQFLFQPLITMPNTLAEFENYFCNSEKFIDFDHPCKVPFFLACKSLLQSFKLFKPTSLNLTVFSSRKMCSYILEERYTQLIDSVVPWYYKRPEVVVNTDWIDYLANFCKRMKRLCKLDTFRQVEFVSLSGRFGRNYCSYPYINLGTALTDFKSFFPSMKYSLQNFIHLQDTNVKSVTIVQIQAVNGAKLVHNDNIYTTALFDTKPESPIEVLKKAFPNNYPTNIEILLYNSITPQYIKQAQSIIDNFHLDINLFSHVWNVQSSLTVVTADMFNILQRIYKKYPKFRVFRIPIDSIEFLSLIQNCPFVDIDISKNITVNFLQQIGSHDIPGLARDYNINFSKLGLFQFSAVCFNENLEFEDRFSCDVNGISPSMINLRNIDTVARDKFGCNILHYYYYSYGYTMSETDFVQKISDDDFRRLLEESNNFGVSPNEIAVLHKHSKLDFGNFKKRLNSEGINKTLNSLYPRLLLFDGLVLDAKMWMAYNNQVNEIYDYTDYKDINFRDENGKHLVHYQNDCFISNLVTHLNVPHQDVLFVKDNHGTMPIQTCVCNYYTVLDHLGKFENIPNVNFVSLQDEFGMLRILYLLIENYLNTEKMVMEAFSVGFDYTSGQPELLSLHSHYSNGFYLFTIQRSVLKPLKNLKHFGTVDGDDISHYILRFYFDFIRTKPLFYVDNSIIKVLIARGLRLDKVRNSKGQTAFDLFDEFQGTPNMLKEVQQLKKVCRRGITKSQALSKFKIQHTNIPSELLVESTETSLTIKSSVVSPFKIRMKRSLYFPKKMQLKDVLNQSLQKDHPTQL